MPVGKKIYSTDPGNRLREEIYLLHAVGNLLRHTCYAHVLMSQPLSSASALCDHMFGPVPKNSSTFVLLMGMFLAFFPLWVFLHADFTLARGDHGLAFLSPCLRPPTSNLTCGGHAFIRCRIPRPKPIRGILFAPFRIPHFNLTCGRHPLPQVRLKVRTGA